MNKIIKIFVKVLLALCLLPFVAAIVLAVLLTIPSVQNAAVHLATEFATEKIGAPVHIEKISVGLINRVKFNNVYVEDLSRDTLLYVGSLSAKVGSPSDIFEDGITISSAVLKNARFDLRETERGKMNIKEIVDKISKHQGKGNFSLKIHDISVENLDFRLIKLHPKNRSYGVDFSNLLLKGMNMRLEDFRVKGPGVGGTIHSLSFTERSGFDVRKMDCSFWVDKGLIDICDLSIDAMQSKFFIPKLCMSGDGWPSFKDFENNVKIDALFEKGSISSDDVAYFAPKLKDWHIVFDDAQFDFRGKVSDFTADIRRIAFGSHGNLSANVHIMDVGKSRSPRLDVNLKRLDAKAEDVFSIISSVVKLSAKGKVTQMVDRMERISMYGAFRGRTDNFDASAKVQLLAGGSVNVECRMKKADSTALCSTCSVDGVDLGHILSVKHLGKMSLTASADGTISSDSGNLSYTCQIGSCVYKGYSYHGVKALGSYLGDNILACIESEDENAGLLANITVNDIHSPLPKIGMSGRISNLNLYELGLNGTDSLSRLSATLSLSVEGFSADSLRGKFFITQAEYLSSRGELHPDTISLFIGKNLSKTSVALRSDYVCADYSSMGRYGEDIRYARGIVRKYLPSLFDDESSQEPTLETEQRDDSKVEVRIIDIDTLLNCIWSGYSIAPDTRLDMNLNPQSNRFALRLNSSCIGRNQVLGTQLRMHLDNLSEVLKLDMEARDIYLSTMHLSRVDMSGKFLKDSMEVDGFFTDSLDDMHGRLKANALLSRPDGVKHLSLSVDSSFMESKNRRWIITSGRIEADTGRIWFDNFVMRGDKQESMVLDGVASRSLQDSLCLSLNNFSLKPLLQFTNKLGYDFSGTSNGYVNVKSVMDKIVVNANVGLDSLCLNGIDIPKLRMLSRWNISSSRAAMHVISENKGDTLASGYYSPLSAKYYVETEMDSVDLSLMNPILRGVVSDTKGKACINMHLLGQGRKASLKGNINVNDFKTTVDFTKCAYEIPSATIDVNDNHFVIEEAKFTDKNGKSGKISMDLSLEHLSNVKYMLLAKFSDMQVLDTSQKDNDMFYGSIRATGTLYITGNRGSTKLDILAMTNDGSEFFMPLSGKTAVANADFITFESKSNVDTLNYLVRKKMMFERKNRKSSVMNDMEIAMALTVTPGTEIQLVIDPTVGDVVKARGNGTLNLNIRPKQNIFEMLGDYTITEGSYLFTLQNIINKRFTISPGSMIQWTGEPLDALLNINAVYRVKASLQPLLAGSVSSENISSTAVPVDCILMLRDRLTHPTVDFNVEVPNSDASVQSIVSEVLSTPEGRSKQFLYLLIANSFISEGTSSSSSGASSTVAVTGLELLSNQLSNWLSNDDYRVILRFRPKTERNMSDEVDFGFSKGLINNRLLIEVEGNYLVDKSKMVNSTSNFTGEAYVTWLIDRAGTMRLKGFTHTIDRFDETQGLQETGLGIYYKEDFDNAADFKKRIKYRFTRKKKRKRQMEEKDSINAVLLYDNKKSQIK